MLHKSEPQTKLSTQNRLARHVSKNEILRNCNFRNCNFDDLTIAESNFKTRDINNYISLAEVIIILNAKRRDNVEFSPSRFLQRRKATRHQSRIVSQRIRRIFERATFYFNRSTKVRADIVSWESLLPS